MSRLLPAAWFAVAAVSIGAIAATGRLAASARTSAATARYELAHVADNARELLALRAAASSPAAKRASTGLAQRTTAALTRAGLPTSTLSSLSPESQSVQVEGEARLKRRRATLVLNSLTLPQLGAFLDAWRTAEPDWSISGLDVAPASPSAAAASNTGGDLPLRVVMTLEAITVEEPPSTTSLFLQTPGGPR